MNIMENKKIKQINLDPDVTEYKPFLRVKKVNSKAYLYEVTQYYHKITKKRWQSCKYIRKIYPHEDVKNITKDPLSIPEEPLKLKQLLSYGDAYLFHTLIEEIGLRKVLLKCFSEEDTNLLLILAGYRLLYGRSVSHLSSWMETSDLINFYPYERSLSSQSVSKALTLIGEAAEETVPDFFFHWSQMVNKEGESILFDLNSFTSQANNMEELEYGYAKDNKSYPQLNMGLLVDQNQHLPLYYKVYPGSLKDVSVLSNIVEEVKLLGVSSVKLNLDRGFYSQYNFDCMYKAGYSFLLPLPRTSTKLYKQIMKNREVLESPDSLILLKRKPLYVLGGCIEYPGLEKNGVSKSHLESNPSSSSFLLYYGLYMDPEKKQREDNVFLTEMLLAEQTLNAKDWSIYKSEKRKEVWREEAGKWYTCFTLEEDTVNNTVTLKRNVKAIQNKMLLHGITILLSSKKQELPLMLELYRQRDEVEKFFDTDRNELCGIPLRVHNSNTMKSTLFILFLSMIIETYLSGKMKTGQVDSKYSIQSIFFELHKLKKAIWKGKICLINEITREQRTLFKQLNIVLPDIWGNSG